MSGAGALTQLIATGALDQYLSHNASFTFWKVRYNKHTNFAMEAISQPFNTAVGFGGECQITLNRNGDLIYYMYVVIELPGITACVADKAGECGGNIIPGQFPAASNPCQPCLESDRETYAAFLDSKALAKYEKGETPTTKEWEEAKGRWGRDRYGSCAPFDCCEAYVDCPSCSCDDLKVTTSAYPNGVWAHWTNDIGQFLVKCARIVIGGSTIDSLYNDFLFMWEELTGKSGKRLTEMVGKRYTRSHLVCDSRTKRTLWIPLPFWFTQHSGQALALASLQFHGVQVHIEFESLAKSIVVSDNSVAVKNCSTGCCLNANDLSAHLETTYVYLDTVERDRFATTHYEVLIVQNQSYTQQASNSQIRLQLNFNHPVIELIWAVRRRCNEFANNWFNFSGIDNRDPVLSCALFLNNQPRFSNKPGQWFRLVQPYQFHSNIPDAFVYCYSFALHPEDPSPSGSCNFSRIDHVDLTLTLQEGLANETVTVCVYARNWNVLRFREGLAGIAFSN